jgi:hypothetical protein
VKASVLVKEEELLVGSIEKYQEALSGSALSAVTAVFDSHEIARTVVGALLISKFVGRGCWNERRSSI